MDDDNRIIIKRLLWLLLIPFGIITSNLASAHHSIIEKYYSSEFYPVFSQSYSSLSGLLSFSAGELLLYVLVISAVAIVICLAAFFIKNGRRGLAFILKTVAGIMAFLSIAYIIFIVAWGLNYYREPFARLAGYDSRAVTKAELIEVSKILVHEANVQRQEVMEDSSGVMKLMDEPREELKKVNTCYETAALFYPKLAGRYGNPKPVAMSVLMCYQGISGIYSPFTAEANVNMLTPDCMLPATACHEAAHLRGFAREDEANFIAYLACSYSKDVEFRYSGTLLALVYSMNALRSADNEAYLQLRQEYDSGVVRDLIDNNKFWEKYSGPVERASEKMNNAYLKANKQAEGVASYGRMVDLLIMKYRKDGLKQ